MIKRKSPEVITITCPYCRETTSGIFRGKPGHWYYDCPVCGLSSRLKEIAQLDGPSLLVPGKPPRENRGMVRTTLYLRADVKEALLERPGQYSEYVNLVLAKALGL